MLAAVHQSPLKFSESSMLAAVDPDRIREVDAKMDEVYDVLIRDALDASACLEGSASQEDGSLFLNVSGE